MKTKEDLGALKRVVKSVGIIVPLTAFKSHGNLGTCDYSQISK